ncbi:MAG: phosphotransferase [Planctomycetota bacterium]|nr:phosphotransferase [Planctomycetota bacterium]
MNGHPEVAALLSYFPTAYQPRRIRALQNAGGYSGAQFWKLDTASGPCCLRRWPQEASRTRLNWIHEVVVQAAAAGLQEIPVPLVNAQGKRLTHWQQHDWELAPWMPGNANFHQEPSAEKLVAAMHVLARFHLATAQFGDPLRRSSQTPPGLKQRLQRLKQFQQVNATTFAQAVAGIDWPGWLPRAERLRLLFDRVQSQICSELSQASHRQVPLQPCLRDIWHDHILFSGNRVTGLIDFGAMRMETVAGDLARLLGSLARDDPQRWHLGLTGYEEVRRLEAAERALIAIYDRSAVALSGMNWLWWLAMERRRFENREAILRRLDDNASRLALLAAGHSPYPED